MQCCPTAPQAVSKQNLKASEEVNIPPGGSVHFKYETTRHEKGTTHEMRSNTVKYGLSETFVLNQTGNGKFQVDISKNIQSIKAIVKDRSGNVVSQKDLLEKKEPEVIKIPEVKKEAQLSNPVVKSESVSKSEAPPKADAPLKKEPNLLNDSEVKLPNARTPVVVKERLPRLGSDVNDIETPSTPAQQRLQSNSPAKSIEGLPSLPIGNEVTDYPSPTIQPLVGMPKRAPAKLPEIQPESVQQHSNVAKEIRPSVIDSIKKGFGNVVMPKVEEASRNATELSEDIIGLFKNVDLSKLQEIQPKKIPAADEIPIPVDPRLGREDYDISKMKGFKNLEGNAGREPGSLLPRREKFELSPEMEGLPDPLSPKEKFSEAVQKQQLKKGLGEIADFARGIISDLQKDLSKVPDTEKTPSKLRSRGIGGEEELISPFTEVPTKEVKEKAPAATMKEPSTAKNVEDPKVVEKVVPEVAKKVEPEVAKKVEPEVAKLDLTKLVPGTKLMYTASGIDPNPTPNSIDVPPKDSSGYTMHRGKYTKNADGETFTFTANPGQKLEIKEAGKQASVVASSTVEPATPPAKATTVQQNAVKTPASTIDISQIKPGKVNQISGNQALTYIHQHPEERVLLLISGTWCGPCQLMNPSMEALAKERNDLTILKVYEDHHPDFVPYLQANKFAIEAYPTILEKMAGGIKMKIAVVGRQQLDDQPALDNFGQPTFNKDGTPAITMGLRSRFAKEPPAEEVKK